MKRLLRKIWYLIRYGRLTLEKLVPDVRKIDTDDLIRGIEPGDIVTAAMNVPLDVLAGIPKDHRIRPYIIAKKENGKLYGYCGTSRSEA